MNSPRIAGCLFWLGALQLAVVTSAPGQPVSPSLARWAVTLKLGVLITSPSAPIQKLMEDNALSGSSASFFGTINYPSIENDPILEIDVERFWAHSSLRGNIRLAEALVRGRLDTQVRWRDISLTPVYAYYSPLRTARISVGPSLHWLLTEAGVSMYGFSAQLIRRTRVVPGLMLEAGFRFPARSEFFIDMGGRYEAVFGQAQNEIQYTDYGISTRARVIPFSLRFNQFTFNLGVGIRIGRKE